MLLNFTNASQLFGVWKEADLATSYINPFLFEIKHVHLGEVISFVYFADANTTPPDKV